MWSTLVLFQNFILDKEQSAQRSSTFSQPLACNIVPWRYVRYRAWPMSRLSSVLKRVDFYWWLTEQTRQRGGVDLLHQSIWPHIFIKAFFTYQIYVGLLQAELLLFLFFLMTIPYFPYFFSKKLGDEVEGKISLYIQPHWYNSFGFVRKPWVKENVYLNIRQRDHVGDE